jgi:hypothetical protein
MSQEGSDTRAEEKSSSASFEEIFNVELDGWCYGISSFPGETHPALVHRVIKELSASFRDAVDNGYAFNILDVSTKLSRAAKYLVAEKEIAMAILYQIPNPADLDDQAQFVAAQLVDQVEKAYSGALEKIQKKWLRDIERSRKKRWKRAA